MFKTIPQRLETQWACCNHIFQNRQITVDTDHKCCRADMGKVTTLKQSCAIWDRLTKRFIDVSSRMRKFCHYTNGMFLENYDCSELARLEKKMTGLQHEDPVVESKCKNLIVDAPRRAVGCQ